MPEASSQPSPFHSGRALHIAAALYLSVPSYIPAPRNNPHPKAQALQDVELLNAFHQCFGSDGGGSELRNV